MAPNTFPTIIQKKHIIVLIITLFIMPLLWGTGSFKIQASNFASSLDRPSFWTFFFTILVLQWLAFLLIFLVTKPKMTEYLSVDKAFLSKNRWILFSMVVVCVILAGYAPIYLYGANIPSNSILGSIGPVSDHERIAFIFLSLTAGICEEVIFRGYGISVLERIFKKKAIALIVSAAAFMSLHGIAFLPWYLLIQYFIIGLIFGFFFQKYRRLEVLIIIHFLIDAMVAISVP